MDYTTEEWKTVKETHKILHDDTIEIIATTVRVPVFNAHCESIYIETEKEISVEAVRTLLSESPGITVMDGLDSQRSNKNPHQRIYPTPLDSTGKDEVFVGRIRRDPWHKCAVNLWVVGDNLRKGAALNAVQIAELVIAHA
jgi:aspartate-semialdehyde dehydrogenase